MKSALFVRPNLKLFLLGAGLIICMAQVIGSGQSKFTRGLNPIPGDSQTELPHLLERVANHPTAEGFRQLADYYESRREYRKALFSLRQAERFLNAEDAVE